MLSPEEEINPRMIFQSILKSDFCLEKDLDESSKKQLEKINEEVTHLPHMSTLI